MCLVGFNHPGLQSAGNVLRLWMFLLLISFAVVLSVRIVMSSLELTMSCQSEASSTTYGNILNLLQMQMETRSPNTPDVQDISVLMVLCNLQLNMNVSTSKSFYCILLSSRHFHSILSLELFCVSYKNTINLFSTKRIQSSFLSRQR